MSSLWPAKRLLRLWGKTKPGGDDPQIFHPALFHMLDVAHVVKALLSERASTRWRQVLSSTLNSQEDDLAEWLPWLISLHDIGKISAPFQYQSEPQRNRLISEGFTFGDNNWGNKPSHGEISEIFYAVDFENQIPDSLRRALRDLAGGHHGFFTSPVTLSENKRLIRREPGEWLEGRKEASKLLAISLNTITPDTWPEPENISTAVMVLTGFTILCDWIGSDSMRFPPCPDLPLDEYIEISKNRANTAVEAAGFLMNIRSSAPYYFSSLFPDKTPRPIQTAIDSIPDDILAKPFLAIIEASTGEGKTEAALALAHRIAQTSGTDELYYALPTTATSNQMFGRLQKFLIENLALGSQVKLVHGQAFLFEDDLRIQPLSNGKSDEYRSSMEWFAPKKRALLSPFGVGTIDQAELTALNVKHVPLRMMGLAGKVLIIDEVHAYDIYMTTIIERMLNWLSALGTTVILLSATLPKGRRTRLAEAFNGGPVSGMQDDNAYPSLWIISKNGIHHDAPSPAHPERTILIQANALHFDNQHAMDAAQWLVNIVEKGGCACWMTNTVARAQAIFDEVDRISSPGIDRMLLHSQFPMDERQVREKQITEKYGPGNDHRPMSGIVIGTQVLEQSLDLDFDVMVTDLAPVDLVLQRAGRLHRHSRMRPSEHKEPMLWLNTLMDGNNLQLGNDRFVYDEYILRKSWEALKDRTKITLPADYRPLIEEVYGYREFEENEPLKFAFDQLKKKQEAEAQQAYQRLLPEPDADDAFSGPAAGRRFEESEMETGWIVARTRLGEETITVIPLEMEGNIARAIVDGKTIKFYINADIPRETQLGLLRHSLRISNRRVVEGIKSIIEKEPTIFSEIPLLKDCFPLRLTNGTGTILSNKKSIHLTLDPRLGLVVQVEKGVE